MRVTDGQRERGRDRITTPKSALALLHRTVKNRAQPRYILYNSDNCRPTDMATHQYDVHSLVVVCYIFRNREPADYFFQPKQRLVHSLLMGALRCRPWLYLEITLTNLSQYQYFLAQRMVFRGTLQLHCQFRYSHKMFYVCRLSAKRVYCDKTAESRIM